MKDELKILHLFIGKPGWYDSTEGTWYLEKNGITLELNSIEAKKLYDRLKPNTAP